MTSVATTGVVGEVPQVSESSSLIKQHLYVQHNTQTHVTTLLPFSSHEYWLNVTVPPCILNRTYCGQTIFN